MNPLLFFFQSASAGGVLLFLAAILGLVMANTGLAPYYEHFLHAELGPLPVHLWINDVLMAIFFQIRRLQLKLTPWGALPCSTPKTQKRWQPR